MKHLEVFYFFITFSIGIFSLGIAVNTYLKTKEKFLRYYLFFYLSFTLLVFSNIFSTYVDTNVVNIPLSLLYAIIYIEEFIARNLLLIAITVFIHYLFSVPDAKQRNLIVGAIAILWFIVLHPFAIAKDEAIENLGWYLNDTVFTSIMLYNFLTGIYFYKQIEDMNRRNITKKFLLLFGIAFVGLINDIFLSEKSAFRIYPLVYFGFSIIFSHHFIKYYLHQPQIIANTVSLEDMFEKYNISPREKEIISLILQGYSNAKIGKTLFISLSTVKTHLSNIYPKVGVKSRYELIALFKNAPFSPNSENQVSS